MKSVEQISPLGKVVLGEDEQLSVADKESIVRQLLGDAKQSELNGSRCILFDNKALLIKQITYLGHPHSLNKKRIQIPHSWIDSYHYGTANGYDVRFIGIYHYGNVTIVSDFGVDTYIQRKAHNSSAHIYTNDLFQAQSKGYFERIDIGKNEIKFIRGDNFFDYLTGKNVKPSTPHIEVFRSFNEDFLSLRPKTALDAVKEMYMAAKPIDFAGRWPGYWPDTFQAEWPGFYLEYRFSTFVNRMNYDDRVSFEKNKKVNELDFDLCFWDLSKPLYLGDLKASDHIKNDAPGNDQDDFNVALDLYKKFWYVVYEHKTSKLVVESSDYSKVEEWNRWKQSVGYFQRSGKKYNEHSYAKKFKDQVTYFRMKILEVNEANKNLILSDFNQGHQPGGGARKPKFLIRKSEIDNFLVMKEELKEDKL